MDASAPTSGRRSRFFLWFGGAAALIVLAFLLLAAALLRRPGWYRPQSINHASLEADQKSLVATLDAIGAALNTGAAFEAELTADQINRWIAARHELAPPQSLARVDRILEQPFVALASDGARLGGLLAWNGVRAVASTRVQVALGEQLELHVHDLALGALSMPGGATSRLLDAAAEAIPGATRHERRLLAPRDWVWPNGKRPCRITKLEIADGVVRLRLEPR